MSRKRDAVGLVTLCISLLGGCRLPGKPVANSTPLRPDQVTSFAQLYNTNCSACHGQDGRKGNAISLHNATYIAYAGEENIRKVTSEGIAGSLMPAFAKQFGGTLTEAQVAILAHSIATEWADPAALRGATPPAYDNTAIANPVQGLTAYKTYCLRCHAAGRGSLVDPAYLALITDGGLRTLIIAGVPEQGMPNWAGYPGGPLTNQQITDVVGFLNAHRTPAPGQPYPNPQGAPKPIETTGAHAEVSAAQASTTPPSRRKRM